MLKINYKIFVLLTLFFVPVAIVIAAGPKKVAYFDRGLWPEAVVDDQSFDRASRFEIYHFSNALGAIDLSSEKAITEFTGVKNPNLASVKEWEKIVTQRLLAAYLSSCVLNERAQLGCGSADSLSDLHGNMSVAYENFDAKYNVWKTASMSFHMRYLYEQVRLAALFPRVSSEILTFNDKEMTGFELKDREFLLTFDDGPSRNLTTEKIIEVLNDLNIKALFFVLGERLKNHKRDGDLRDVYAGHCIASHGYIHKAHPKLDTWKSSIDKTNSLIVGLFNVKPKGIWFRPPYGQRSAEMLTYLYGSSKNRNMLWNIDSQDWNRKITSEYMASRVMTLMLLWRKGVVLFHDLYDKNIEVVKVLKQFSNNASLYFKSCGDYSEIVRSSSLKD